jgi:Tfp pilus assembly protein PilZ
MSAKLINAYSEENMKILNIGYGGALLRTSHNLKTGDAIKMKAYLPLFAQPIDIGARVVRVNRFNAEASPAMVDAGVEFKKMDSMDEQKLSETIDVLIAKNNVAFN